MSTQSHKAQITISSPTYGCGKETVQFQVRDVNSRIRFLQLEMSYRDFARVMTGMSEVECEAVYTNLGAVGKKKEQKELKFLVPPELVYNEEKVWAEQNAQSFCDEGWLAALYFNAKDSFYTDKDENRWAKTRQFRWI